MVTVDLEGGLDTGAFARVHAGAAGLIPEQPLFGVTESDWPAVFLLDPADGGASPESRLGQWIVALTVALQRWARDAVWRGRVLGVAGGRLMLAIPWQREGVLSDTLRLALRLIELWAAPPAGRLTDVNAAIRQGMAAAQDKGLLPSDVRFALAALERGIPVTVRPNHIQYGWGVNSERMRSTFTGSCPTIHDLSCTTMGWRYGFGVSIWLQPVIPSSVMIRITGLLAMTAHLMSVIFTAALPGSPP